MVPPAAVALRHAGEAAFQFDPRADALASLASRTLLVGGDGSPNPMIRLVDALHGLMPGSTRTVVRDANHLLPLTHASQPANALLSHLHAAAERELR